MFESVKEEVDPLIMENYYCRYTIYPRFVTQPPENLRKSNFFNCTVVLRDPSDVPIDIMEAYFTKFLNEDSLTGIRNGIEYKLRIKYPNGITSEQSLFLTLVDAATREPIKYEGHDDNPKMQRVLLTHEAICTRCSLGKSCGNKNEAPSHPQIVSKGVLKFFLKCNQNCLKGAGNPRDMRRFALALSFDELTRGGQIIEMSTKMFVHNNSKHNSKRRKRDDEDIARTSSFQVGTIHPAAGIKGQTFAFYSKEWAREGATFMSCGVPLHTMSLVPQMNMMTVHIPPSMPSGVTFLTLWCENRPVWYFPYEIKDMYPPDQDRYRRDCPGFLMLLKGCPDATAQIDVGKSNMKAYVTDASHLVPYPNPAVPPSLSIHYPSPQMQYDCCQSTTPSPNGSQLSGGSDSSSPTYPCVSYMDDPLLVV